jgi:hypothetical protein
MRARQAIALIEKQRAAISGLRGKSHDWAAFNSWQRETEIIIKRLFGEAAPHAATFHGIRYSPGVYAIGGGRDNEEERHYWSKGFDEAEAFLRVLTDEVARDTRFGRFSSKKTAAIVDGQGKITIYWLTRHLPARFVWIGFGALLSAVLFGVKLGQVAWIKELFTK